MSATKFTMAARCEAAGRPNNEDNFQLTDNLSDDHWGFVTGKEIDLGEKGALMVVCDGMGGMNAGEVASGLAIQTIKDWFTAKRLTPQVLSSSKTIIHYIEQAIIAADQIIKETGNRNSDQTGMGSTIVLAWFVGKEVYIGWCGDSRAYRFNPVTRLERLSHDHSYVQELVDNGKLLQELAFDHPDNNIITRSLGDANQTARPEVKCFPLCNDDTILLCSDGLCGVLRDSEIESFLSNAPTIDQCRNALWTESEKAGWTDNVTIALCRIISGGGEAKESSAALSPKATIITFHKKRKMRGLWVAFILLLLLGIAIEIGYFVANKSWWYPQEIIQSLKPAGY